MQRSGSQKALLVFSIIEIVCAAFMIAGGILASAGAGVVGSGALLGELTLEEQSQSTVLLASASISLVILGIWGLLCGIFGIRAANDNQKIMIVWTFLLVGLILNAAGIVWSIADGSFGRSAVSIIVGLVFDIVLLWIANNIKREAGK